MKKKPEKDTKKEKEKAKGDSSKEEEKKGKKEKEKKKEPEAAETKKEKSVCDSNLTTKLPLKYWHNTKCDENAGMITDHRMGSDPWQL